MSVSTTSDSVVQEEGLSSPASGDMSYDSNYTMPTVSPRLPATEEQESLETAIEGDEPVVLSDDQTEWLMSEQGKAWRKEHGFYIENEFQENKANLQRAFSAQVNAAQSRIDEMRREKDKLGARNDGLIMQIRKLSEQHGFDLDEQSIVDAVRNHENAFELQRQQQSTQQRQQLEHAVGDAMAGFEAQFNAMNQASGQVMDRNDSELNQLAQQYHLQLVRLEDAKINGNEQSVAVAYGGATDIYNRMHARMVQMIQNPNPNYVQVQPDTQTAQMQTPPPQAQQPRLPQRSAAGGGGSAPPSYDEIFQNKVSQIGRKLSAKEYENLATESLIEYEQNRYS